MRNEAWIVLLAALVMAAPLAAAEETTITAPEVNTGVRGTTVDLGERTEKYSGESPATLEGKVVIRDVDVSSRGTSCKIGGKLRTDNVDDACRAGSVTTPDATSLVTANVGLRFGSIEQAPNDGDAGPLAASAAIVEAVGSRGALMAAAAAGASLAGAYAIWRLLKWTGLAAFIPLYSHISDDEILDDPNRAAIYRLIQQEAGISTKDIADRLDLAWGTVTHHLTKLEKRRFVVSKKYGKYRRYFANGEGGTERKDAVAVLRLDRTGDIAALIKAQPGLTQKAVSQALGVSSSTILWHVKRLEDVQLVRKVREGKIVRYYPADGLDGALITPPGAASPQAA